MLPPVDSAILTANPKFDALYRDICTNSLEQDDTSTLEAKARREHDHLEEEVYKTHIEAYRRETLCSNLESLAYRHEDLPDELRELVVLATATLNGHILDEDRELVEDELERFRESMPTVNVTVSRRLAQDLATLAHILGPGEPIPAADLPATIRQLQANMATSHAKLAQSRFALAREVQTLHDLYRQVTKASMRTLEQTIHGSVARGSKAQADYLATVAEGMNKKLGIQHAQLLQQVYTPEMQDLLKGG
ncbi:hypothetical protein LTR35_018217 [Friedmanniomyces endolithicus]|uniref:Uncharacterized protein n=1 Tax=Friedmanniomyces endolithicus TaxID=329885 RepID=A0AAN6F2P8_9PEZI|nr:hypothetical protein LTR35_018217 [Friedmanniomyces endolithicus]KAK0261630.1 hypothetical protein LTS00_018128 [Friedmanniomyces endolithicus]KAK0301593.1 hypothetical protein LTR82_018228 [Friedmanniomyces endolithicus]KAK0967190.1 hypothetical protein LTR54_018290 [Friedmanniomyces endolithicus]